MFYIVLVPVYEEVSQKWSCKTTAKDPRTLCACVMNCTLLTLLALDPSRFISSVTWPPRVSPAHK